MNKLSLALAAIAAAATLSLSTMAPASADGAASTRNIIIGAAAIAGIAIESNIARKDAQANAFSGYLPDGPRFYGDGHVVGQNGYSVALQTDNGRAAHPRHERVGNGYDGNGQHDIRRANDPERRAQ
jgi:hypothetical protein